MNTYNFLTTMEDDKGEKYIWYQETDIINEYWDWESKITALGYIEDEDE